MSGRIAHTVFISYAREDLAAVLEFARVLRTRFDVVVHMDLDCNAGDDWERQIEAWVQESNVLLVWVSGDALQSGYVQREIALASQGGATLVPIITDEAAFRDAPNVLRRWNGIRLLADMSPAALAAEVGAELKLPPVSEDDGLGELLQEAVQLAEDCELDSRSLRSARIDAVRAFHQWRRRRFQVAIVALVKAGKSTTINAWLGDEFLPMSNVPETARVVRITHDPGVPNGLLRDGVDEVEGARKIKQRIELLNREARASLEEPADLDLQLSIGGFKAPIESAPDVSHTRLEIIDTPGPNEAGAKHLRARSHAIISDADAIVYVLDYTKLNTNDETLLLDALSTRAEEALREWRDRLFFVVNKIDLAGRHDLKAESTREYASRLLSDQLGFAIPEARIQTVSAKQALLARLILNDCAGPAAREEFARHVGGMRWERLTDEDLRADAPVILEDSGFPGLEQTILDFLRRDASRLLRRSTAARTQSALSQLANHLKIRREVARKEADELAEELGRLDKRLTAARTQLASLDKLIREEQEAMAEWTAARFASFRTRLEGQLDELAVQGSAPLSSLPLQLVRDSITSTARVFRSNDDEKLHADVQQLVEKVVEWGVDEFSTFRVELQSEASTRQNRLIGRMQDACIELARALDHEVEATLNLDLEPLDLELPTLTQLELHEHIDVQISRVTAAAVHAEKRRVKKEVVEQGFCGTPVWRTKWMDEFHHVRGRRLDVDLLVGYIRDRFLAAFSASETTATAVTFQLVKQLASDGKRQVEEHADRYQQTLRAQLEDAQSGVQRREGFLTALDERLSKIETLTASLAEHVNPSP